MRTVATFFERLLGRGDASREASPLPSIPKEEQLRLLRSEMRDSQDRGALGHLVEKHFNGHVNEAYKLFSISKSDYLAWAKTLPLTAFVSTEHSLHDDFYLLQRGNDWVFIAQERGQTSWEVPFETQEQALAYVRERLSPYGIFPNLRSSA